MSKKVSRRDFALTSVAAGAAAVVAPGALVATEAAAKRSSAAEGAALARRVLATMPPEVGYGGVSADGPALAQSPAAAAPKDYPGGWREGTTIPAEYYLDESHYVKDEKFIAEHFWLMADHESRIPKAGD